MKFIPCDVEGCNRNARFEEQTTFGSDNIHLLITRLCPIHADDYDTEEDQSHRHEFRDLMSSEKKHTELEEIKILES